VTLNPYLPYPVRLVKSCVESEDASLKTLVLEFVHPLDARRFQYRPGQFAQLSVPGVGECPIGIASSPTEGERLMFTVNRAGVVTGRLHDLVEGDILGVRGPLGNGYPMELFEGRDLVLVAGGFAVTTLRATMIWLLDENNRGRYGRITFIYGARSPGMLLYRNEWCSWQKRGDVDCHIVVDRACPGWAGPVCCVPTALERAAPRPEDSVALVCGPPAMIRFCQPVFEKLGWGADQIYLSLENRMKCGLGICGRCNVGPHYVCKDGPVFTKAELDRLPKEY